MLDVKSYLRGRSIGFYVTLALFALLVVTAIVYAICFAGSDYVVQSDFTGSIILLIAAMVVGIVFILFKGNIYVPVIMGLLCFVSLLIYIHGVYYSVSIVLVGIDPMDEFIPRFIFCTVLYALVFLVSLVNLFLPQTAKEVA